MQQFDNNYRPKSFPPTLKQDPSYAAALNIVQSYNEDASSQKDAVIQASDDWRSSNNKLEDYATYPDDLNCMLKLFKSM